jgi:hypothetical protein
MPLCKPPHNKKVGHWGEGVTAAEMDDYIWLRLEVVAEVKFAEWTQGGVLRHSEFVALREDKDPNEVVREGWSARLQPFIVVVQGSGAKLLGMWAEQCFESCSVRFITPVLSMPHFHKPTPWRSSAKVKETIERQVTFQIIQRIRDDLKTVTVRARGAVVERGVKRMAAFTARRVTTPFGSGKNERHTRKRTLAALGGDQRKILRGVAPILAPLPSRPSVVVGSELELFFFILCEGYSGSVKYQRPLL